MSDCKISIILPVYNKQKYVSKVLQDIQAQLFKEFECIIVDDGSTDTSGEICENFAQFDKRFRVIHIKNQGVSHARNVGLAEVTGTYITFIDADDRIDSDYLNNLYAAAEASNADIVISGYEKWWEDNDKRVKISLPYSGLKDMQSLLSDFALHQKATGIYGFCWGKLLKANRFGSIRFDEDYALAEDFEFYLRAYPLAHTIYFDNKNYYYYLQQADNSSMVVADNKIDYFTQLKLNLKYRNFLQKMDAYVENNRRIVDQLLSNYAFFTVFHSDRLCIESTVRQVHKVVMDECIALNGTNLMQKIILQFIKSNNGKMIRMILSSYDFLRKKLK